MTEPADTDKVPAFETALGLPEPGGKPIMVTKKALDRVNADANEEKEAIRYHTEVANTASLLAARAIRPDEIAALRRSMFNLVGKSLKEVDQVLMGTKVWSPTQTRLFAILTERVMPKLSALTIENETPKKVEDLTLEELEALALGKSKASAVDAVVKRAEVLDEQAEKHERRESKRDVIASLAHIDAIDQAEKAYIARKLSEAPDADDRQGGQRDKYQPAHTPESLANVRAARKKTMEDWWREKGLSEEEIAVKRAEVMEKRLATKARLRSEKATRLAARGGFGDAELDMARSIRATRNATLDEFKVHGLKGVRSSTVLARQAMQRTEDAAKREKRELMPRIYTTSRIEGVPEEHQGRLTLDVLRRYRPDLFVEQANGLGAEPEAPEGW